MAPMHRVASHILVVDDDPSVVEAHTAALKESYVVHGAATGKAGDTLNGGTGAETLPGSAGDVTHVVDNASDSIAENPGEGTDLVQCSLSNTLAAESNR